MERQNITSCQNDWADIALPVVLMITGLILLGGDYLGMLSLDRVQNFWPLALMVIGFLDLMPRSEMNPASKETHVRQLR